MNTDKEDYRRKLIDYFKKNSKKGYNLDTLKLSLLRQGYSRTIVDICFEQANKELAEEAPRLRDKPSIKVEVLDEHNKPVAVKKSFLKRIFGKK